MTVLNYNVFHNTYEELIKIDSLIIPNSLKTIVNNLKALETELFKTNNIKFRNSIIEFAHVSPWGTKVNIVGSGISVALSFITDQHCASWVVPITV